jgi:hypothetical protein
MTVPSIMTGFFNSIGGAWFQGFFQPTFFNFRVPQGVTKIHAVCVGGGGGGGGTFGSGGTTAVGTHGGGGGGALSCTDLFSDTGISVIPGEILSIGVGKGGSGGYTVIANSNSARQPGFDGGDSYIKRGDTYLLLAKGGTGGTVTTDGFWQIGGTGGQASAGIGAIRFSGGNGGGGSGLTVAGGGGGAAGYGGNGGNGTNDDRFSPIQGGSLGGNGAGSGGNSAAGGGGIGQAVDRNLLFSALSFTYSSSGSGGTNGSLPESTITIPGGFQNPYTRSGNGGFYGGGGGAGRVFTSNGTTAQEAIGGYGAWGVVRIIWGPNRKIPDIFIPDNYLYYS